MCVAIPEPADNDTHSDDYKADECVAPIILVPSERVCFVSDFNYLQLISRPIKTCGASKMQVIKKISAAAINSRLAIAIMAIGCD